MIMISDESNDLQARPIWLWILYETIDFQKWNWLREYACRRWNSYFKMPESEVERQDPLCFAVNLAGSEQQSSFFFNHVLKRVQRHAIFEVWLPGSPDSHPLKNVCILWHRLCPIVIGHIPATDCASDFRPWVSLAQPYSTPLQLSQNACALLNRAWLQLDLSASMCQEATSFDVSILQVAWQLRLHHFFPWEGRGFWAKSRDLETEITESVFHQTMQSASEGLTKWYDMFSSRPRKQREISRHYVFLCSIWLWGRSGNSEGGHSRFASASVRHTLPSSGDLWCLVCTK